MKEIGDYRYERMIGRGAEGIVYQGESIRTGEKVAVKELLLRHPERSNVVETVMAEYKFLKTIRSPYLVNIKKTYTTPNNLYIVYSLYARDMHSLFLSGFRLSALQVRKWTNQILKGLVDLHYFNIVHRDLKPQNILFTSEREDADVVITDFGVAAKLSQVLIDEVRGTIKYMAPEVKMGDYYDTKADVFSLGILVKDMLELVDNADSVYYQAHDFADHCLENNQYRRPSSYELSKHGFIQDELKMLLEMQVVDTVHTDSVILNEVELLESQVLYVIDGGQKSEPIENPGSHHPEIDTQLKVLSEWKDLFKYFQQILPRYLVVNEFLFNKIDAVLHARDILEQVQSTLTYRQKTLLKQVRTVLSRFQENLIDSTLSQEDMLACLKTLHFIYYKKKQAFKPIYVKYLAEFCVEKSQNHPQLQHLKNSLFTKIDSG